MGCSFVLFCKTPKAFKKQKSLLYKTVSLNRFTTCMHIQNVFIDVEANKPRRTREGERMKRRGGQGPGGEKNRMRQVGR